MKKLLVLLLVLGMASSASALLQISVNGDPDPVDSQISVFPSDEIILDIFVDADMGIGDPGENVYWVLLAPVSCATMSGGVIVQPNGQAPEYWAFDGPYPDPVGSGIVGVPEGEDGVFGYVGTTGLPIPAGTILFDEILLHCETDNGATLISLWGTNDVGVITGEPWDTVTIHQIPEPMTVALLGLGGLFLLRRRK